MYCARSAQLSTRTQIKEYSSASDSANPINSDASSDYNLEQTNMNDNMLDNLLNGITNANETINDTNGNHDDDQEGDIAKKQCENELYQLLLGTKFKMKIKKTLNQRSTTVLCLGGNHQLADT
jgi:hypothetical protein